MLHYLPDFFTGLADLGAAFLLMYGLHRMASPVTAPSGILLAGVGMAIAIVASFLIAFDVTGVAKTLLPENAGLAVVALLIGGGIAWVAGRRVAMTAMPQMVAIYNGMGGGAAGAIAAVELFGRHATGYIALTVTLLGALIGAISFSGSLIAWAKLQEVLKRPLRFPGQRLVNGVVFVATVALGVFFVWMDHTGTLPADYIITFFVAAMLAGILITLPIGGADMPVIISIYNAFTGLAVGLEGFVLQNPALMIAGMVVGAAGLMLTLVMAKAMNRSVSNVVFANFGDVVKGAKSKITGDLKPTEASDAAVFMRYAAKVVIVPGYGLAAAQGQQKLWEFVQILIADGVNVRFAIHPVAGRMPGQMDVLLAEAGVPYDRIFQLDDINDDFATTDVALVIGANDVVNPAARTDKSSPIYGMPILNVDKAKQVYVLKRGTGKGYAGIQNELFYSPNCNMVYGDAAATLAKMIEAVRGLKAAA
jgi:NAD(P) transhydrogenase subunit beta